MKVYKVFSVDEAGNLRSWLYRHLGRYALHYKEGEKTCPKAGKIFAYPHLGRGRSHSCFDSEEMWECEAEGVEALLYSPCPIPNETYVEAFWTQTGYERAVLVPAETWNYVVVVDSLIPIRRV